jgi:hypothetical protein
MAANVAGTFRTFQIEVFWDCRGGHLCNPLEARQKPLLERHLAKDYRLLLGRGVSPQNVSFSGRAGGERKTFVRPCRCALALSLYCVCHVFQVN